jgi:hypothetical protein
MEIKQRSGQVATHCRPTTPPFHTQHAKQRNMNLLFPAMTDCTHELNIAKHEQSRMALRCVGVSVCPHTLTASRRLM